MRLVHYQYKPEFAATVGIENTAETGNNFIKKLYKFKSCISASHLFVQYIMLSSQCLHLV